MDLENSNTNATLNVRKLTSAEEAGFVDGGATPRCAVEARIPGGYRVSILGQVGKYTPGGEPSYERDNSSVYVKAGTVWIGVSGIDNAGNEASSASSGRAALVETFTVETEEGIREMQYRLSKPNTDNDLIVGTCWREPSGGTSQGFSAPTDIPGRSGRNVSTVTIGLT